MKKLLLFSFLFISLNTRAQEFTKFELVDELSHSQMIQNYGSFMQYGVRLYTAEYESTDLEGSPVTVSGLVVVPIDNGGLCYPRLIYQHGTVGSPDDVPSQLAGGYDLAVVFAGMGYITLAPDFLGLGVHDAFHPYVHADSEAAVAVDMLKASSADTFLGGACVYENLVYVTGYSQGGHAAMAAFRELEANHPEYLVKAAAPMSGPYDISGVMTTQTLGDEEYFFPAYLAYTTLSYQEAYGDLYDSLDEVFKPEFVPMIEQFYNDEITLWELNTFMINTLTANYGGSIAKFAVQEDFMDEILNDPDSPVALALQDNDLYDWTPQAPTRMFYCTADDQVPYENSISAEMAMLDNGAPDVDAIDVDTNADHGGCVEPAVTATILFFNQHYEFGFYLDTEEPKVAHLTITPNPVEDVATISIPAGENGEAQIRVFNAAGKTITSESFFVQGGEDLRVSVQNYPSGLYFVELRFNDQRYHARVLKD
ncbi:MAG: T9SS type A sorting domain-containing protein [Bacteroidetes bacterium]|nr:T9SS type A sorting domain-containing protein [Bacteroidota bacterium]